MAALSPTPPFYYPLPTCDVCGCEDVDVDYVDYAEIGSARAPSPHGAFALELAECPRCDHRWTRPLRLPTRRELQHAAAMRVLHVPIESIPNAA